MKNNVLRQAVASMRQQPMLSIISVVGMALALFLIMVVVMIQQVKVVPFAPESGRDRFLHGAYISVGNDSWGNGENNGPLSVQSAKSLYFDLGCGEISSIHTLMNDRAAVSERGGATVSIDFVDTDANFWKVYDFDFIAGKPYDEATVDAAIYVAVITESVARKVFGTVDVIGRELLVDHTPYTVSGVVKDVSTLASSAFSQMWLPYTTTGRAEDTWCDNIGGAYSCTILAADRDDFPAIREAIARKTSEYEKNLSEMGYHIISRNRPYDQEKQSCGTWANNEPDVKAARTQRWIVYLILLIVPAINLSSMTESRLRRRVSEIGVRRAFGCTRSELFVQIIAENFIITVFAGIIAMVMSLVFALLFDSMLFAQNYSSTLNAPVVDVTMLLRPSVFGWALLFCFILNLLSSGIPAWRASRTSLVNAINGRQH